MAALKLLEEKSGPIIKDFPKDVPDDENEPILLACPLPLAENNLDSSDSERLRDELLREFMGMRSWYDLSFQKKGRTTVGVSRMSLDQLCKFLATFITGDLPENPRKDIDLHFTLNLAIDDLKAFYGEAMTARPGQEWLSGKKINDWFWNETVASKAIFAIQDVCVKSDNQMLKFIGQEMIVPVDRVNEYI